ncbi:HAD family hydrolase [Dyella sp. A6]|uniref:HAD family hydrolase n=1 Tax=Dyella aluminiiresistens TaxID=3069105 RepID=UPI002E783AA7|nr:HAD family hydrolase [Dyella sp. A6]
MLTSSKGPTPSKVVILLDVDDTLLDNDRFGADLAAHLTRDFGPDGQARYQAIYEARRTELGYADYLGAAQTFREGCDDEAALLRLSAFLLDYPFADRLYPRALEALAHLGRLGTTGILSDGDIIFQPRKIQRSGLWQAVDGRVLVYVHKERMLHAVQHRLPADHYVMVDDKPQLLAAMKRELGTRLTSVFVRQGHYAAAVRNTVIEPPPDRVIDHIGELCDLSLAELCSPALSPEP